MANKPEEDDYIFDRSYIDNSRLNLQHKVWVDIFGYLLHPSIPTSKPDLAVADIGTGTGIWLNDLSRHLPPTAHLDGFDITLQQAEPRAWFPKNVAIKEWDVMSDVPEELVGKYDVVHIRLFVFVVPSEEGPKPILEKLVKLLKPGGYLQWSEVDVLSAQQRKLDPANSSESLDKMFAMFMAKGAKVQPTWVKDLPTLFQEVGLEGVKNEVVKANERDSYLMNECNQLAWGMWLGKDEKMERLFGEAIKEARKGVMFDVDRVCVVGRKGLEAGG